MLTSLWTFIILDFLLQCRQLTKGEVGWPCQVVLAFVLNSNLIGRHTLHEATSSQVYPFPVLLSHTLLLGEAHSTVCSPLSSMRLPRLGLSVTMPRVNKRGGRPSMSSSQQQPDRQAHSPCSSFSSDVPSYLYLPGPILPLFPHHVVPLQPASMQQAPPCPALRLYSNTTTRSTQTY